MNEVSRLSCAAVASAACLLLAAGVAAAQVTGQPSAAGAGASGRDPAGDERFRPFGYVEFSTAYTYPDPDHLSKLRARAELGAQGKITENLKWKVTGVGYYDAAYRIEDDHYTSGARDELESLLRWGETYLDWTVGDAAFRFGRQHIVWGEMVALFVADVVSARDLTEFILPEFSQIRIPQWAARAEYDWGGAHFEAIWIPYATYDRIGKPNGDFYPYPLPTPGYGYAIAEEVIPSRNSSNMNYGFRVSGLVGSWDLAGFYYRSTDAAPTFYRTIVPGTLPVPGDGVVPGATAVYEPRHDRIWQAGGTFSNDFSGWVVKGEAVYTSGRKFNTVDPTAADGLVPSDTLDWIVGVDFTPADDWRMNAQLFQRVYFDRDPGMLYDKYEWGASFLANRSFGGRWEAEVLVAAGFNRSDWMVRPAVIWNGGRNWRMKAGFDLFGGDEIGFFGRYDRGDRAYVEARYTF